MLFFIKLQMQSTSRKLGYIRVSTEHQHEHDTHLAQEESLKNYGCTKIFTDQISGKIANPPNWERLLKFSAPNDIVVVFRLDRLGRTLSTCLKKFEQLHEHKLTLIVLDSVNGHGRELSKFQVQILGAVSEMEMELREQRCKAGILAKRKRGYLYRGRMHAIRGEKKREIDHLFAQGFSITKIAEYTKVSRTTLYAYKKKEGPYDPQGNPKTFERVLKKFFLLHYCSYPAILLNPSNVTEIKECNFITYIQALTADTI